MLASLLVRRAPAVFHLHNIRVISICSLHSPTTSVCTPRSLQIGAIRLIRTRHNGKSEDNNQDFREQKFNENSEGTEKSEGQNVPPPPSPEMMKKLRIYVLVVAGVSFVMSFFMLADMFKGDRAVAGNLTNDDFTKKGIDYQHFVDHYLKRGEVQRILFSPAHQRAIAFLQPGAVIDGKPVSEDKVTINYPQEAKFFWADVRKVESDLGIPLTEGVKIDLYQGMTTIRLIELLVGVFIIAWLGTQYGRLLRKRFLENQAKKGTK